MALTHQQLVDHNLHAHTHQHVDLDNTLTYYIHDQNSSLILGGYASQTLQHHSESQEFISSTLQTIDQTIDLDLHRVTSPSHADLRIYAIHDHQGWDENTVGQVIPDPEGWSVLWKSTDNSHHLSDFDANTIIHEIGHALGLSHPGQNGHDQRWSTKDTVMSYNVGPEGWNYNFSATDQQALIHLWGKESEPIQRHHETPTPIKQEISSPSGEPTTKTSDWTKGSFSILLKGRKSTRDNVIGTAGNDVLVLGDGRDRLKGSKGSDLFLIPANQPFLHKNIDVIVDFEGKAGDKISIVHGIPKDLVDVDVNFATAQTVDGFNNLKETDATVIYDKTKNQLFYDENSDLPGLGKGSEFAALQEINLLTSTTKKATKKHQRSAGNIIYFQPKGLLFYDENGAEKGYGDGGLIAKLKGSPTLSSDNLQLWVEPIP